MNQAYSSSQYSHGGSYVQDSNSLQVQNHTLADHALRSDNSIGSYEDLMMRSDSNDGTHDSWQLVDDSSSSAIDSSPELARPTIMAPLRSRDQGYHNRGGLTADGYNILPQPPQHPPMELDAHPTWVEQTLDGQHLFPFNNPLSPLDPHPTYSATYGTTSSTTSTIRGLTSDDRPWSQIGQYTTTGHELVATTTAFALPPFTMALNPPLDASPWPHNYGNFNELQAFDTSNSYLAEDFAPRHRSRSSSNSQIILTPPQPAMDLNASSPQPTHQSTRPRIDPNALSQSLIVQAGSDIGGVSSPSSGSDVVVVPRKKRWTDSATAARRKRQRTTNSGVPPSDHKHGRYMKLGPFTNQQNDSYGHNGAAKKPMARARGGRKKNTHLSPEKANDARAMRSAVACWVCALQRDHCTIDEVCDRCVKRHERGAIDANHSLGCIREKLFDYLHEFIPDHVQFVYGESELRRFADDHMGKFIQNGVHIDIEPIPNLPYLPCDLYEFEPIKTSSLVQRQYWQDGRTKQYNPVENMSAPISFKSVGTSPEDQTSHEKYVAGIANTPSQMRFFAEKVFYQGPQNKFLANLFTILVDFQPHGKTKVEFVKSINKLLLTCFIFARGCRIPTHEQHKFQHLRFFQECQTFSFWALPRMASRQFKHIFLRLLINNLEVVLRRLDRVFRSSQGCKEWIMAFYGVLGLAMAFEYIQLMVRMILHSECEKNEKTYHEAESALNFIISRIDEKFSFMSKLFRYKYNKSFNPIAHEECIDRLDPEGVQLVMRVSDLLKENPEFIYEHQRFQPTLGRTDTYLGRLVSQFLCSVASP